MKKESFGHSGPVHAPLYPEGIRTNKNFELIQVLIKPNPEKAAALIPEPLEPDPDPLAAALPRRLLRHPPGWGRVRKTNHCTTLPRIVNPLSWGQIVNYKVLYIPYIL